jgi:UDP-glucuronate 4-epimerase
LKILVTGAAGFIGSHTCDELLKRGHQVVGIDNLNDYYSPERKRANIEEVRRGSHGESFSFEKLDLRDRDGLSCLFEEHDFEAVVNLGAMAGVRISIEDPHLYYDVNQTGTLNLLLECVKHKVGNFVLASTSSAYGNTEQIPFVENDPCDRPVAPYAASKRAAEMLAYTYHYLFGVNATVLRFFTVYGPRGRPDMMAYKVLDNIFFQEPCKIYNNGEMWRDWTYVGDIVQGVSNAAERPLGYEIINLGRGEMVKLSDFVSYIEELTGKPSDLKPAPKMAADIDRSFADISKARRLLDYDPKVSVKEGVVNFYRWYQSEILQAESAAGH